MTALINPERTMRQQRICAACALRSRGLQGAEAGRLLIAAGTPRRIETFLLPYARHMRAAGWRVDALANGAHASAVLQDEFSSVHDIDWSRSPVDLNNYIGIPGQLRELVSTNSYDVVHVHSGTPGLVLRFALRKLSRPRVVYTANGFRFHGGGSLTGNALHSMLERMAGPWTDELIVVNTEDHAAALRLHLVPTGHLHLLSGSGIDLARFQFQDRTRTR